MSSRVNSNTAPTMSTKKLVIVALMCALSILLSFIEFPIFPTASFLKLDVSLVPSAIVGLTYGTGPGVLCGIACAIAHAIITGNWVGALMSGIVAIAYICPLAAIYKRGTAASQANKRLIIGLVVASLCLIVGVTVANLIIDPIFYGMPFESVAMLVGPAIIPFNIIKSIVVSILTAIVFKAIANLIKDSLDE